MPIHFVHAILTLSLLDFENDILIVITFNIEVFTKNLKWTAKDELCSMSANANNPIMGVK